MIADKNNEDDISEACGTIVELGSVINEDDTVLVLPFTGSDSATVNKLAEKYIDAAKERFASVEVNLQETTSAEEVSLEVSLSFECTVEKLIFEMGLSAI